MEKGEALGKIKFLLNSIILPDERIKDDRNPGWFLPPEALSIATTKEEGVKTHNQWLKEGGPGHVLYTDRSRNSTCLSEWYITNRNSPKTPLHQGHCNIRTQADILDAEIHAIREGVKWLLLLSEPTTEIAICVDNQGALRSLAGGKCKVKEDLRISLEGIETLQAKGYSVTGHWTSSHLGIHGNDQADTLAEKG